MSDMLSKLGVLARAADYIDAGGEEEDGKGDKAAQGEKTDFDADADAPSDFEAKTEVQARTTAVDQNVLEHAAPTMLTHFADAAACSYYDTTPPATVAILDLDIINRVLSDPLVDPGSGCSSDTLPSSLGCTNRDLQSHG